MDSIYDFSKLNLQPSNKTLQDVLDETEPIDLPIDVVEGRQKIVVTAAEDDEGADSTCIKSEIVL